MGLCVQEGEVVIFNKSVQFFFSVGYSVVAVNHVVDFKEKKQEIEKPVAVSELFTTLPIVQRATSSRVRLYDVVAVFPKTEKLFHIACTHLDVDLICVTVTEKLPFYFKRPPINVAIDRGLAFELVYSPAIKDSTMRRYTISNALNLMQICKGKAAVSTNCRAALLHGDTRKTAFGIISTVKKPRLSEGDEDCLPAPKKAKCEG
ncbi:Ribonuclease P protein subunit p30 [Saguinus oedipus]|uniref:Ribonuclease P protein subunit p30 n=1 Tax=Saguinus oedipus TaxID=9490 RepID=A0ABQ9UQZ6_SAGOE|nr:Ribonuclease P protein subunit p30 [Saguinus oedipus]